MKVVRLFTLAALVAFAPALLGAGPVAIRLLAPPPGQYAVEDMWQVDIDNQTQNTYSCWLHGEITEAARGQVFRANSREFQLPPGKLRRRGRADVDPLRDEWHAAGYEQFAAQTGGLPEGSYTFIVTLEPDLGDDTIQFEVRHPGPPRLISPRDGDTIKTRYPLFVWTPPMPAPSEPVTYELKIVEILPGQTREAAMKGNPPWFEDKGGWATSLRYPSSGKAIAESKRYAWQVVCMAGGHGFTMSETGVFVSPAVLTTPAMVLPDIPFIVKSDAETEYLVSGNWQGGVYQPALEITLEQSSHVYGDFSAYYDKGACWITKDAATWPYPSDEPVEWHICRRAFEVVTECEYQLMTIVDDQAYVYVDPPSSIPDLFPDERPVADVSYRGKASGRNSPFSVGLGTLTAGTHWLYVVHRNVYPRYYAILYAVTPVIRWVHLTKGLASDPALGVDGTVYVSYRSSWVAALDPAAVGEPALKWIAAMSVSTGPAIGADGTVYVGCDREVRALSPDPAVSDRVKWSYVLDYGVVSASPAIGADGTVYVASGNGRVYALDPSNPDHRLKWSYATGGEIVSSPAIGSDGVLYVGSNDGKVYALDPAADDAHRLKWSHATGGPVRSSPAIGPTGLVYVGSDDGSVYALKPGGDDAHRRKWSYATGGPVRSSPAIVGWWLFDMVCVGSDDGYLYLLNPYFGHLMAKLTVGAPVRSSPAVSEEGVIYVCASDGALHVLKWATSQPGEGELESTTRYDICKSQHWGFEDDMLVPGPALGRDGTVYVPMGGFVALYCFASHTDGTSWPKWGQNSRNTRRAP